MKSTENEVNLLTEEPIVAKSITFESLCEAMSMTSANYLTKMKTKLKIYPMAMFIKNWRDIYANKYGIERGEAKHVNSRFLKCLYARFQNDSFYAAMRLILPLEDTERAVYHLQQVKSTAIVHRHCLFRKHSPLLSPTFSAFAIRSSRSMHAS